MGVGLSSYDWQNLSQEYVNTKLAQQRSYNANSVSYSGNTQSRVTTAAAVSSLGNYCTDGIDDGKIGFLSAAGNIVEGAGKAVVNGVKGMFTDKNGHFSLLKTIGTVALGAACIAFPAAGLVMCGIGAVAGGTKLVKGISNAITATTDAEAKDAWEAVGDGALTTAVSVAGAKASMGAIKTSAGATSELAKLSENATWLEKLGALGKDMLSSTKNNFKNITEGIKENGVNTLKGLKNKATLKNAKSTVGDNLKSISEKIKGIDIKSIKTKITKSPKARYADLKATLSSKAQAVADFMKNTDPETYSATDLVQTFGYDAVIEALEVFASYRLIDETV